MFVSEIHIIGKNREGERKKRNVKVKDADDAPSMLFLPLGELNFKKVFFLLLL